MKVSCLCRCTCWPGPLANWYTLGSNVKEREMLVYLGRFCSETWIKWSSCSYSHRAAIHHNVGVLVGVGVIQVFHEIINWAKLTETVSYIKDNIIYMALSM